MHMFNDAHGLAVASAKSAQELLEPEEGIPDLKIEAMMLLAQVFMEHDDGKEAAEIADEAWAIFKKTGEDSYLGLEVLILCAQAHSAEIGKEAERSPDPAKVYAKKKKMAMGPAKEALKF